MNMISRSITTLAALATLSTAGLTGCASMNNTERGATVGAGTGGAIGAVIGKNTGNTARGAILGAVVGGAAGAIIGRRMDNQAQEIEQQVPGATVERVGEGIAVSFPEGILFPYNSDQVLPAGQSNIARLAQIVQKYPGSSVLVVGHTDAKGSDQYNMALSQRRAAAAANYLSMQGISRAMIRTEGRGETEPIADNSTDAGRARNRRVEVAIFASPEYRQQILRESGSR